ncbi:endolytic transglycosylase MltG [Curtobacterium sp. MCBD17_028]|uniref:endolytic transglycosylase MltG n=1 Tax=Curtobacterium sp. MCBD17_028 TaxID=2175670 RepID=UPI0021ABE161|nr:endolytic transglycosylase MltG [Curtobacterium sp. MCBD17_028]
MADDLDWRAIIAPGDDADQQRDDRAVGAADDRAPSAPDRAGAPLGPSAADARPPHLTRRAAREAAARADRSSGGDDVVTDPQDHHHSDVRALFGHHDDETADRDAPGRAEQDAAAVAVGAAAGRDGGVGDGRRSGRRGGASRRSQPPRRRRSRGAVVAGIVIVAIVLAGGAGATLFVVPKVQSVVASLTKKQEPTDYTGSGTGKVTVTIKEGDIGSDVAKTLHRSGVVKTSTAFYQLLLTKQDVQFQPGSYQLKHHMSAKAALAALQDSANKVTATVLIPEGTVLKDVEASLVSKAGLTQASVTAAAADVSGYGLPAGVTSLEGYLFPATYPINPSWTATQYFQSMVDTMNQHLDDAGVPVAERARVVTFASVVQKEAGLAADYPKVARVFQNRIDQGMPLQSDATVAYGTGHTDRVTTTDAERADAGNPYNTYQHKGLPPGPISNPGDIAINAVMHPAAGSWLYFVTVDLQTGATVFSTTYAEHEAAVAQWQAWMKAHPDYK